jgi:hypothetical protein
MFIVNYFFPDLSFKRHFLIILLILVARFAFGIEGKGALVENM